ncbi:MAG TPA: methyltransferase domain-containing protein [Dissulfurispiraceae bacterium]|nr:methyltransferase domain-containing protein [Dissulfurispiraceae bacterium]
MDVEFTSHNIRLDDGTFTRPESPKKDLPFFASARRILNVVFPGDKSRFRLADLGCLEGGYSVEFARMGFQVLGLEVRESNIAACNYVKANTNLPKLEFVQDNAWNILNYGTFDAIFCCGLLYHLDQPKRFLEILAQATSRIVIIQTHFSLEERGNDKYVLSEITEHDSILGRWYTEFNSDEAFRDRNNSKWSSYDNRRSFWIQREYLIQAINDVGFDLVFEQFDGLPRLGSNIADSMTRGYYKTEDRGTFIGIKTHYE